MTRRKYKAAIFHNKLSGPKIVIIDSMLHFQWLEKSAPIVNDSYYRTDFDWMVLTIIVLVHSIQFIYY